MSKTTRILIVEDESIQALELENRLVQLGFQVVGKASSGEDAIKKAGKLMPDLVLMDIHLLPGMDGIEAAKAIHERYDLPVVYVTAHADKATVKRATETQPFGYIIKPYEGREIQISIETALFRHRMEKSLKASEARFRRLIDGSPIGKACYDQDGRLFHVNPAYLAVLRKENISGLPRQIDRDPLIQDEMLQTAKSRKSVQYEKTVRRRIQTKSGGSAKMTEVVVLDITISPLDFETGKPSGFLVQIQDVTEQHRMQEALKKSNAMFHSLIESIPMNIIFKDLHGKYVYANRQFCETENKSLPAVIGKTDADLFSAAMTRKFKKDDKTVMATGQKLETVERHPFHEGDGHYIHITRLPVYDDRADIAGIMVILDDVTEKTVSEKALARERELLQTLMDNIPDSIYFKDRESRFIRNNKSHAQALGLKDPLDALGMTDLDFYQSDHAKEALRDEQRIFKTGQPIVNKIEHDVRQDGWERWVSTTKVPIRDDKGRIMGLVGISRDITEMKKNEQALSVERDLLQKLMDNIPDPIYFKNRESRFVRNNLSHVRTLGFKDPKDVLGKTDYDFFQSAHADEYLRDEQQIMKTGQPLLNKVEHNLLPDGSDWWVSTTKVPIRDIKGRITGLVGISRDITEIIKKEQALSIERDLLATLMDTLPDSIYFKDRESRFIRINKALADVVGLKNPRDAVGKRDKDFFASIHAQEAFRDEQEIVRTGKPLINKIERDIRKDGWERWVSTTKMPIRDKEGRVIGIVGISRDITDFKKIENELSYERELFETLMNSLPDSIYFKDRDSRFMRVNRKLAGDFGVADPKDAVGKCDGDFLPKEDVAQYREDEIKIIQTGVPLINKIERELRPGTEGWVSTTKMPLRDKSGEIIGIVGLTRNVTDLKKTEEALARERDLLQTLMDNLPDSVYFKDRESRFLRINRTLAKNWNIPRPEDAIGKSDHDYLVKHDADEFRKDELRIIQTGEPIFNKIETDERAVAEGQFFSTSKVPVRDASGKITGIVGVTRDVTELKRAQYAARDSEILIRQVIDATPNCIYLKDASGRYILANQEMANVFKTTPETMLGKTGMELAADLNMDLEEISRFLADDLEVIKTRKTKSIPNDTMHLWDGSVRWFQTEKIPLTLKGRAEYALGVSVDITERKLAEERLKTLADELKLSNTELEQFAYVASHDLQEPLRMVASYVQLLARKYQGKLDTDADEFIHYAVDGANRMQRLINDLLLYSRVGTKGRQFAAVDLNVIMDRVMGDLSLAVEDSGAEIRRGPLPMVMADEIQMGQLLQNLIGNALKFRGEARPLIEVGSIRQGKEWVCTVKDNGIGIDPQYKERIFMIFQRLHTRDQYPGTGIGLAVCKKIVERHGGRIWVESEPSRGAAFHFTLPMTGGDRA